MRWTIEWWQVAAVVSVTPLLTDEPWKAAMAIPTLLALAARPKETT